MQQRQPPRVPRAQVDCGSALQLPQHVWYRQAERWTSRSRRQHGRRQVGRPAFGHNLASSVGFSLETDVRIPITIQQFPAFTKQVLHRSRILRQDLQRKPKFWLCYFSCYSYYPYLACALHSLKNCAQDIRYQVIVFNDSEMPLSAPQIKALEQLIPSIRVISWPKSMGWGEEQIGWIWRAYAIAAETAEDTDIVARVDSDVYFFNDRIFRLAERTDADLLGDGHYVNFEFCQGGCYFFKAAAIRKINAFLAEVPASSWAKELDVVVEDVAATHFSRRLGLDVRMTWFMMFPDELRNAGRLNAWQRWKFSCAHFVMKNKALMLEAYERDVLSPATAPEYRQLLTLSP